MISSLTLENFQKHQQLHVSFKPGLNLIVGPNWAGKSTIQRAILFALFGSTAVPVRLDQLVTIGSQTMQVCLEFDDYRLVRGNKKALLTRNGHTVASGQSSVTAEVESILGTSAKNFLAFRVARQNEAGSLLSLGVSKLSSYINSVTGVDLVDRVLERIKLELATIQGSLEGSLTLANRLAEVEQLIKVKTHQQASSGKRYEEALAISQSVEASYQQAQDLAMALYTQRTEAEKKLHARAVAVSRLASFKEDLNRLVPVSTPDPSVSDDLKSRLVQAQQQSSDLEKQQNFYLMWNEKVRNAQDNIDQAKSQLSKIPVEVETKDSDPSVNELSQKHQELLGSLKDAELKVELLRAAHCPTCQRPYQGQLWNVTESLKEAQYQVTTLQGSVTDIQNRLRQAQDRQAEIEAGRTFRESWEKILQRDQRVLEALLGDPQVEPSKADREALRGLERELQAQLSQVSSQAQQAEQYRRTEASLKSTILAIEQELLEIGAVEVPEQSQVEQALRHSQTLGEQLQAAQKESWSLYSELQQIGFELTQAQTEVVGLIEAQKKLDSIQIRQECLSRLSKYLKANRDRFMMDTWEQVLGYANAFIREATSGSTTGLRRSDNGEFLYQENGSWMPVELASGMQEAILGTGLKIALGASLGSACDFLLFDEVSAAGQDENSLLMTGLLKGVGSQVILISHRAGDAVVADNVIEI